MNFSKILGAAALVLCAWFNVAPAQAQEVPCQWKYANVAGVATATYCGQVVANGFSAGGALTLAQMQSLPSPVNNLSVVISGLQGGQFIFNSASTCTVDGGTCFTATDGTIGKWERQYSGPIMVQWFSGADIGAQYNAAYAMDTANREIDFPSGKFSYSTPIVENTVGICPNVKSLGGTTPTAAGANGGTYLNYTPTTGTAWFTDCRYASDNNSTQRTISNIYLINNDCKTTGGCASGAHGLEVGLINGGDTETAYYNVGIQGFGVGYQNLNPAAIVCCEDAYSLRLVNNTVAMNTNTQSMHIYGGVNQANGIAWENTSAAGKTPEIHWNGTTIVDNVTDAPFQAGTVANASLYLVDTHLENNPSITCHYFTGHYSSITMLGDSIDDDSSTGTCDWMIQPGNDYFTISIDGTSVVSSRTTTEILDATHASFGHMFMVNLSPVTITTPVGGTYASKISWCFSEPTFTPATCQTANPQIFANTAEFQTTVTMDNNLNVTNGVGAGSITNGCSGTVALVAGSVTVTNACITGARPITATDNTSTTAVAVTAIPSVGQIILHGTGTDTISWMQN